MLELKGIPTTTIGLVRPHMDKIGPPRGLWVPFQLGRPLGEPGDKDFQRRVVLQALALLERKDGYPTRVRLTGKDERGRTLEAEGVCHNRIGVHLNPNLWTWNCLTEWQWNDGRSGWGEDHDNWSAAAFRRFVRGEPAEWRRSE